MMSQLSAFIKDESGATAIEYGLIAAGIGLVIISAVQGIGGKLSDGFSAITNNMPSISPT